MSACELCWEQAFRESRMFGGSQADHYHRLLEENEGKPGHESVFAPPPNSAGEGL